MKLLPIAFVILCTALTAGAQSLGTAKPYHFHCSHYSSDTSGLTLGPNNGQPLYLIDGVLLSAEDGLSAVNPNDISAIKILKGNEARVYGEIGINGVVLITTKKLVLMKTTTVNDAAEQYIGIKLSGKEAFAVNGMVVNPASIKISQDFIKKVEYLKHDGQIYLNLVSFAGTASVSPKPAPLPSSPAKPGTIMIRGTASAATSATQQY